MIEKLTLKEALALEEKIYAQLKERIERARLAEADYWKWLDCEDEEEEAS